MIKNIMYCQMLTIIGNYLKRTGIFSRRRRKRIPEVFAVIRSVSTGKKRQ